MHRNLHYLLVFVASILIATFLFQHNAQFDFFKNKNKEKEEKESILDMFEWNRKRIMDLELGYVPVERLAYATQVRQEKVKRLESARLTNNIFNGKWIERGPYNVGGRTRALLLDANDPNAKTLWAGGVVGGLWKCTDIYASNPIWQPINDTAANLSVTSIVQSKVNSQIMMYSTGDMDGFDTRGYGIWRSMNGGSTWQHLPNTVSLFQQTSKMLASTNGDFYVVANNGCWKSSDNGNTFTRVYSGETWDIEQGINGTIYISTSGTVQKTTNNGTTWSPITPAGFSANRTEIAVSKKNAGVLYLIGVTGADATAMHKTINDGNSWSNCNLAYRSALEVFTREQGWYDLTLEVDPNNDNKLIKGGIDNYVSSNGGSTWTRISDWIGANGPYQYIHADQHGLKYAGNSSSIAIFGSDGGVAISVNGTIKTINDRYNVSQFYHCAMHPDAYSNYFLAGAQDNGSNQFDAPGLDLNTREVTGGDGGFCHIDQVDPNYQFTSYVYHAYYMSFNGGRTFNGGMQEIEGGNFINYTDYDSRNSIFYGVHSASKQFLRWFPKQGANAREMVTCTNFAGTASCVQVSPNSGKTIYFGTTNGNIIRVDNPDVGTNVVGVNLKKSGMPIGEVAGISIEKNNENHIIVCYSNYGQNSIWQTLDGGENWESVEGDLPDIPVRSVIFNQLNADQAMIATELGVWATDNLNASNTVWQPMYNGMPNTRVDHLEYRESDNLIAAATFGRGLWTCDAFTIPSAIFSTQRILYTNSNTIMNEGSYQATSWNWDFGNGSTSSLRNPSVSYANADIYTISLSINNNASSQQKQVLVLPYRDTEYTSALAEYAGDFESRVNDFGVETIYGSAWERGNSTWSDKGGTHSGANAYVIGLNERFYRDDSESYLYTPDFDLSENAIYELNFYAKHKMINTGAGVQVQYSIDKGNTWMVLNPRQQDNWYNYTAGTASPFGAGASYISKTEPAFKEYFTDISSLAGNSSVAFRFVFKSVAGQPEAGIAIDDITIQKSTNLNSRLFNESVRFEDGNNLRINWNTEPQVRVKRFEVYTSRNDISYTKLLDTVPIVKTSSRLLSYSYLTSDANATSPSRDIFRADIYFVKIKMIDENDNVIESRKLVARRGNVPFDIFIYSPQVMGSRDEVNVTFSDVITEELQITVFDANGKLIVEKNAGKLNSPSFRFFMPEAARGVYYCLFRIGDKKYMKRIVR